MSKKKQARKAEEPMVDKVVDDEAAATEAPARLPGGATLEEGDDGAFQIWRPNGHEFHLDSDYRAITEALDIEWDRNAVGAHIDFTLSDPVVIAGERGRYLIGALK